VPGCGDPLYDPANRLLIASPVFSPQEFEERRHRLLMLLESQEVHAVVLFASKVEAGYVRYYSSYESQLGIQDCSFLVVTPGFRREWPWNQCVLGRTFRLTRSQ
jgi:hypothetical protein